MSDETKLETVIDAKDKTVEEQLSDIRLEIAALKDVIVNLKNDHKSFCARFIHPSEL